MVQHVNDKLITFCLNSFLISNHAHLLFLHYAINIKYIILDIPNRLMSKFLIFILDNRILLLESESTKLS